MSAIDLLWVTDPWENLHEETETTLRLVSEAHKAGLRGAWCHYQTIRWSGQSVVADVHDIIAAPSASRSRVELASPRVADVALATRIVFRPDLVNRGTAHALKLAAVGLERAGRDAERVVVNPPRALLGHGEKLAPVALAEHMAPSVIASRLDVLLAFGAAEGTVVLKPLDLHQSIGVRRLHFGPAHDRAEAEAVLRSATEDGHVSVILQRYVGSFADAEKRLCFVNGKLLAWAGKCPREGAFPLDMDRNARLLATELTEGEERVAAAVGAWLSLNRIALAGVDVIGGFLTDVNFVSPGLLVELEGLVGRNLAGAVIETLTASVSG
jgi:glutathione synthetase